MRSLKKCVKLWDIVLCIVFAMWVSSPLWMHGHILFMGKVSTDNVVTPWFYDFIARSVWNGEDYTLLREFDYPNSHSYMIEFPSLMDAFLLAPIAWIFEWPEQWAWTLTVTLLVNVIAVASFAKVIGLGRWAVAFSGMSVALLRPFWAEMVKGRLNVLLPGLAILAIVGILLCFSKNEQGERRGRSLRIFGAILAFSMGAISALVYPPFLLMLIPLGAFVTISFWRKSGFISIFLPIIIGGLAYWAVFDILWEIYFDNYRALKCADLTCPDRYNSFAWSNLALWEPVRNEGLSLSGLYAAPWLLVPMVLLHPKFRWSGLGLGIVSAIYAILSLGPCPNSTPFKRMDAEWITQLDPLLRPIWCSSMQLHDFGRYGMVTSLILCICGGMALDSLWRFRSSFLKMLSLGLGIWILSLSYQPLMQEMLHLSKWHAIPNNPVADFLKDHSGEVVAELPFDRSLQFLSALETPGNLRVNPIRPSRSSNTGGVFNEWLFTLSRGERPEISPSANDMKISRVDWVFFDKSRCKGKETEPCERWVKKELESVLGVPKTLSIGVFVWAVD